MDFNWYDYLKSSVNGFFVEFPKERFDNIHKETNEIPSSESLTVGERFSINDHIWECIDFDDNFVYLKGIK